MAQSLGCRIRQAESLISSLLGQWHTHSVLGQVIESQILLSKMDIIAARCLCRLVIQSLSRVRLFATSWTGAHKAPLSPAISWSLLKLMSTEAVMPSNQLLLSRPLPPLPSGLCTYCHVLRPSHTHFIFLSTLISLLTN